MNDDAGADPRSARGHEQNEARVLHFRRELVREGVHIAHVGLRRGESSLFHYHSTTRDTFYVMGGALTVTLMVEQHVEPPTPYRALVGAEVTVARRAGGGEVHKVRLSPGGVLVVEPRVLHCAANVDEAPCHFLCIEGVGAYDFVEADAVPRLQESRR